MSFCRFAAEPGLAPWLDAAEASATAALDDPDLAHWWRAGGTWFVGVDALANAADGRLPCAPAPASPASPAIAAARAIADTAWHRLQVSAVRPGYPGQGAGEDAIQHRFRLRRDGAHLDGLLAEGPGRRRRLREPHAFILGIALTDADPGASPLVVWEGSERVIRDAFTAAFAGHPPGSWSGIDVTGTYAAARREIFATCRRIPVPLARGEAVLVHRMALHGIAPWANGACADPRGRVVAWLRPGAEPLWWLTAP